jgi:ATP-binding cassette subfamily A (ABC1) protein 3
MEVSIKVIILLHFLFHISISFLAGKTSTMCMLTGLIPKTSGHIYVNNIDNIQFYRSKIGYCPQHNISLPYLTCLEHLVFFGQLRGLSRFNAEIEAKNILKKVNLHSKADEVAKRLSGGMLRKLCLANAIIGDTKLLILDEISSGLDPESRRDIWNILLKLKKDHTIFISTHFMEEADVLSDKIAIMENGELIAYGTSMFLKHHYGSGYTIKMLKNMGENKFDRTSVHNTIKRHIPSAEQKCSVEPLYCMTLPYKDKHKYGEMLHELEVNKALYGIESLSITNTTLEEVFLNSASGGSSGCSKIEGKNNEFDEVDNSYSAIDIHDPKTVNRKLIYFRQFQAIFYKKFIYWVRNLPFFCTMVAIPIVMTWFCFLLNTYLADKTHVALKLQIKDINDPLILVNIKNGDLASLERVIGEYSQQEGIKIDILRDKNIEQEILDVADGNSLRYYDNLVGALNLEMSLDRNRILAKIFYSQNLIHSASIMLNFVDNMMLRHQFPDHSIEVINSPLNRQDENLNYIQNLYTEFVPIGLMLYMILYLPFSFKEKISGFKNLQNIPSLIYWFALFLSDLIVHTIVVIVIMLITTYDREGLAFEMGELETIAALFFVYGATCLVIVYITSQCFSSLSSSIMFLNYLQIFSLFGIIMMSSSKESMKESESSISLFHIFPDFALKHSLKVIHEHHKFERNHEKVGNSKDSEVYITSLYDYQNIFALTQFYVANVLVLIIASLFLFFFIENQQLMEQFGYLCSRIQMCLCFGKDKSQKCIENIQMDEIYDDPDVGDEKKNVNEIIREEKTEQEAMVVSQLVKLYGSSMKAVQDVSFSVKKGECFGLLGSEYRMNDTFNLFKLSTIITVNGAGKTTTFEMMTLNRPKTSGRVFINGVNADQDKFLYRHMFG